MIRASTAHKMNAPIKRSNQTALQADGVAPLNIVGETHIVLCRDNINLTLDALVVENLDVDILAGIPFMQINDIMVRTAKQQILISDKYSIIYGSSKYNSNGSSIRRTHAHVLKAIATNNIWPGEYIEIKLPDNLDPDQCFAIEPRNDMKQLKNDGMWPQPNIIESVNGKICIINETNQPQSVKKNEHFCQIQDTIIPPLSTSDTKIDVNDNNNLQSSVPCSELIKLNPDNVLTRGCTSRSPEASETQLGRVKAICDLARLASGIIVVISDFNSLLNNMFSFVYVMARTHGVLLCVRHYTHTLSDT